jgi:hypothetical protein
MRRDKRTQRQYSDPKQIKCSKQNGEKGMCTAMFLRFPYVCPEPVLVKYSLLVYKVAKDARFSDLVGPVLLAHHPDRQLGAALQQRVVVLRVAAAERKLAANAPLRGIVAAQLLSPQLLAEDDKLFRVVAASHKLTKAETRFSALLSEEPNAHPEITLHKKTAVNFSVSMTLSAVCPEPV